MARYDADDLYLDTYGEFSRYGDQLGDSYEASRRSDFTQAAEMAMLFVFGGIANGLLSWLGEKLGDTTRSQIQRLQFLRISEESTERSELAEDDVIEVIPFLGQGLKELNDEQVEQLVGLLATGLTERGFTESTARTLAYGTVERIRKFGRDNG
ncbi:MULTISPECIES: hypothetical protein [unclassified Streptomyces]|uniref:hypothetical protein n=1 Tax=unclassified Streptomyces TaxID=2593676 RepID=UPI002E80BA56|nr:hypothetical protein [Streptomyces sp. NBC_00589]WTI42363.1 hypothetical protein OIC96_49470 [Streptomyces sp. NBC_00775]WUB23955.1 hypothetical protein OHA51_00260 [Streptomyces sp. NBC_00589]